MKIDYINVMINNLKMKEVKIRLPMKNSNLKKALIKNEITQFDQSSIEDLDVFIKSVTNTEIKNFNIKKPTNIYYLNSYFEILKNKSLTLPKNKIDITTAKLKEMMAELLNSDNKNMTLNEIYTIINSEVTNNEVVDNNIKRKLRFSIKKLQKKQRERKEK